MGMLRSLLQLLRGSWKSLVVTDLLFKAVAFVVLTPLVGLLFRIFLTVSGRTILADVDIVRFLIHPLGWLAAVAVGGAVVALFALEQSALMIIGVAALHGRSVSATRALGFVAARSHGIYRITAEMMGRLLLMTAPFFALGGAAFFLLLTDRDINYYLAERPPRFWIAASFIATALAIVFALAVRFAANWSVALQLHLFEKFPARDCLQASRLRVIGLRRAITSWVALWWLMNTALAAVLSTAVLEFAQWSVPRFATSLERIAVVLGVMVLLWTAVNLACNLLATILFALLLVHIYQQCGPGDAFHPPGEEAESPAAFSRLTRGRITAALAVGLAVSTLIGAVAIRSVKLEDDVEITAHRAGAGRAPENTMAAVHQAIADRADWIEIDVQESSDGVVVVVHDSELSRVGGFNARIWAATAEQLRSRDIGSYFSSDYSNERVPTLAEVLEACRGKVRVNIELKYYGHDVELVPKVVALVEEYDMVDDIVIMSLEIAQVQRVQQLRPDWRVGLLTAVAAGDLTRANADFLAVNAKLATPAFIQRAHSRQRDVHVWTINDAVAMSTMISRGVDNIITDRADIARQVLDDRADLSPTDRVLIELAYRFGIVPRGRQFE
jgi:glycerophosphoryl diester phosphodiesterase